MAALIADLRYAGRVLARNPGFAFTAVLTLALGIGASSAVFNLLEAVMLRPLPVAAPQQLVLLTDPDSHGRSFGQEGAGDRSLLSFWEFEYLRDHNNVFSDIFAADSQLPEVQVSVGSTAAQGAASEENARVRLVSSDYFSTLGIRAVVGRTFDATVDRVRGGSPVAVISYPYWAQRFGLDPAILGKTVKIQQSIFEIIGVTPSGFFGETVGDFPDIWVPTTMSDAVYPGRDLLTPTPGITNQYIWLQAMARLKPGVTLPQAKAAINLTFEQLLESSLGSGGSESERHDYLGQRINLLPGARGTSTLHQGYGDPLKLLMGLVALVLLIACANVGNLLLARGTARQKEFAVRIAIGAGRSRLLRQMLVESLLLAFLGAIVGLFFAQWGDALLLHLVRGAASGSESIHLELRSNTATLAFTGAITALATVLFGLIPALRISHLNVAPALKSSSAGGMAESGHRLSASKLFVIAQVAVSLALLVAAGLFVHSLEKLTEVSLGFDRENLLLFHVEAATAGFKGAANLEFHRQLLDKFSNIPGVGSATLSSNGLFQGSESSDSIEVEGYTPKSGQQMHSRMDHVGPGYFSTLGIPLLLGREIGPQESGNGMHVAVINQAFARAFFSNRDPIGKHVRDTFSGNPGEAEIVGVAADSKLNTLREPARPRIYFPFLNPLWEHTNAFYEIRTFQEPSSVIKALRTVVSQSNSNLPPIKVETMSELVDQSLGTDRLIMQLSSAIGLLAISLAAIGLYGVMAYTVARRTRDIGLRMALGASRGTVVWDVLRETLLIVTFGVAIGLPLALAGSWLIRSLLFGLATIDAVVVASAMVLLAIVAALAGFLPARRASNVDPISALRYE